MAALSGGKIKTGSRTGVGRRAILEANGGTITLGDRTLVGTGALLVCDGGDITIGHRSSINPYCVLYGHGGLTIGDDVRIAASTIIVPSNHNYRDARRPIRAQGFTMKGITIEDDVWIGAHVTILDGAFISRGSVIAAGAVVRGKTEPFGVYAGVPAKKIGERS